jgi:hypothetical protein
MLSDNVWKRASGIAFLAAILCACGGGGGGSSGPEPVKVPVPTAQADVATAELNKAASLTVLSNDSISNGGKLALSSVTAPGHGTATISGDTIVYTPTAGYFGKDSFSYVVKDAGTGTATATADVAVTVNASLVLSGRAVDVAANAAVTIVVGPKTFAASTDATGNFSAPIALDTPDSMITITAQGTGANAFVKLISLVGDSKLVVATAGTGTTLTPAKLPGLLVTAMSTSLYANALWHSDGVVPATQQALEQAYSGVSYYELMQTAAVLRSITGKAGATPIRTLPGGVTDTLAFVTNRSQYTSYVRLLPASLSFEMDAVSEDTTLSSIPDVAVNVSKSLVLINNFAGGAYPATDLVFRPDGTGVLKRDGQSTEGRWSAADMTLTFASPEVTQNIIQAPDLSYISVEYSATKVQLRRFTGTDKRGFVSLTYSGDATYPEGQRLAGPFVHTEVWALEDWSNAVAPSDLIGTTLAGVPDYPLVRFLATTQMSVSLNAGGSAQVIGLPAVVGSWRMEDGRLVLDVSNYIGNPNFPPTSALLSMGRVRLDADGTERWLVRGSFDGDYSTYEAFVVRPQPNLSFNETNAVSSLTTGFGSNYIDRRTVYTARADHTSSVEFLGVDGVTRGLASNTSWVIENGKLVMRSYRKQGSTLNLASCPAGAICTVYNERIWTLLARNSKSITVLDSYKSSPTAPVLNTVMRLTVN